MLWGSLQYDFSVMLNLSLLDEFLNTLSALQIIDAKKLTPPPVRLYDKLQNMNKMAI